MQATTALCMVLVTTVGATCVGTTKNATDVKKNGNIFIADCFLSAMKPGEVKTETISYRNTDPEASVARPDSENLYVRDGVSATKPPPLDQYFRPRGQKIINNINRYTLRSQRALVTYRNGWQYETLFIEIKPAEEFRNVPQGSIPAYTIMGEKWDIFIDDCLITNVGKIYLTKNESITDRRLQNVLETMKSYNVKIENTNDYDHCVIADAPCWPFEKRTIEVTRTA